MTRLRLALLAISPAFILVLLLRHFGSREPDPAVAAAELKVGLNNRITIRKDLGPAPFKKVGEMLIDELEAQGVDFSFTVDSVAFEKKGRTDIWELPVHVPEQRDVELREVWRRMLAQVGATYRLEPFYGVGIRQSFDRPVGWLIWVVPEREWWRDTLPARIWNRSAEEPEPEG
jgi:hypothetical protein